MSSTGAVSCTGSVSPWTGTITPCCMREKEMPMPETFTSVVLPAPAKSWADANMIASTGRLGSMPDSWVRFEVTHACMVWLVSWPCATSKGAPPESALPRLLVRVRVKVRVRVRVNPNPSPNPSPNPNPNPNPNLGDRFSPERQYASTHTETGGASSVCEEARAEPTSVTVLRNSAATAYVSLDTFTDVVSKVGSWV